MALSKFKRDEIAFELRHEDAAMGVYNKYNRRSYQQRTVSVYIDGNFWKSMPERQAYQAVTTLKSKGKNAEIRYEN